MRLNLNSLRMFDAAARHLNFRKAGEELNLTQSAVADRVRQLEDALGRPLFVRQARGLALTEEGSAYHARIKQALSIIERATEDIAHQPEKSVSISVTPSFAAKWLVHRLGEFNEEHPDIDLRVEASDGLENLGNGQLDIAVRFGKPPTVPDKKVRLLSTIKLCAVCTPVLADRIGKVPSPEHLFEHSLVEDGHMRWRALADKMQVALPHKPKQLNQTSLAIEAAKSGAGIALVPYVLVASELKSRELVNVWQSPNDTSEAYHLIYSQNPSEAQKRVVDWMVAEVRNHSCPKD